MEQEKKTVETSKWKKRKFILINSTLTGLLLLGIAFSFFFFAKATTPNPGHSWTDLGNGFWQVANTQTLLRTFTFPDTDATVLTSSSSLNLPQRTVTSNTTLSTSTDAVVYVDGSTGPITVTLPSPTGTNEGYVFEIKRIDHNPYGIVTLQAPSGTTIEDMSNISLNSSGEAALVQSDGTIWRVLLRRDYDLNSFHTRGSSSTALTGWYSSFQSGTVLGSNGAFAANKIYAMPLIITHVTAIDKMAVYVVTASGTAEIGIYNDTGNEAPGSLLIDCGSISLGTASAISSSTCGGSFTVDAGLYWMVINPSNVATVRGYAVASILSPLGFATPAATAVNFGWTATQTKGALPATFPSTASTTVSATPAPAIFVHFAN